MAGNHVSQLSPRQRMINMMYLVLTALLALNVSKKVLDSFFKVDKSLTQTVLEKHANNQYRYNEFDAKAERNPAKIGIWNDLAQGLNKETQKAFNFIDSIRFELWAANKPEPIKTKDGKKQDVLKDVEFSGLIASKSLYEMHRMWNGVPELADKSNYQRSDKMMLKEDSAAFYLIDLLTTYKEFIVTMDVFPLTDSTAFKEISELFKFEDVKEAGKDRMQTWPEYKFGKVPVVAVLTFLNQLALDIVTAEDKMLTLLEQKTGSSIVTIDKQIPYGLPKKSYINAGDKLDLSILLMGIDSKILPTYDIYELDEGLRNPVNGVQYNNPLPKGTIIDSVISYDRDSLRMVEYKFTIDEAYKINKEPIFVNGDGMGEWEEKMSRRGKQWVGGVIKVKSDIEEDGWLEYPWATEIIVEQPMSVISATDLKALYVGVGNSFKIAVPGYSPKDLQLKSDYKGLKISKNGNGKFTVKVSGGVGKKVKLWVTARGKGRVGETMEYKIFPLADPLISFNGKRKSGEYSVDQLRKFTKITAKTDPSFVYDLQYQIKSCKVSYLKADGSPASKTLNRGGFKPIKAALANARPGQTFIFSKIKVNVFENKKKVNEKLLSESLSIIVK